MASLAQMLQGFGGQLFPGSNFPIDPGMSVPGTQPSGVPMIDPNAQQAAQKNALITLGLGLMAARDNPQGLGAGAANAFQNAQGGYQDAMDRAFRNTLLKRRLEQEDRALDREAKLQSREDRQSAAATATRVSGALAGQYKDNPAAYWAMVQSNPDVQEALKQAGVQVGDTPDFNAVAQQLGTFGRTSGPAASAPVSTDDIKEYEFAKQGGFQGSFFDYLKSVKAASAPQINPPAGYRWNPDGSLSVIGGGPADPNLKPPSEADKKAGVLLQGMNDAEGQLAQFGGADTSSFWNSLAGRVPGGGMLQSDDYRKYKAAADRWASNYLYLKSGAQAGKDEIATTVTQFFPQPGDGPEVIAQKNAARAQEAASIAGTYGAAPGTPPPPTKPPSIDDLLKKYGRT